MNQLFLSSIKLKFNKNFSQGVTSILHGVTSNLGLLMPLGGLLKSVHAQKKLKSEKYTTLKK